MINLSTYYKKLNDAKYVVVTCMAITLGIAWLQNPDQQNLAHTLIKRLDYLLYDLRFNAFPLKQKNETPTQVAIIDIDEHSLKTIGRFPWSRKIIADLIAKLSAAGVTTITFDVMFSEPENNIAIKIANEVKNSAIKEQLKKISADFDYDQLMANAIQQKKGDVILGYTFNNEKISNFDLPPSTIELEPTVIDRLLIDPMLGYTANIPALQATAAGNGFINSGDTDADGSVRRAPLFLRYGDQLYPSLALQTAMTYLGIDRITPNYIQSNDNINHIQGITLTDEMFKTDNKGRLLIPYRGPQKTFPYFSAADVLQGKIGVNELAGKMVVVGTSAVGLNDLRTTPMGANYPGVEAQATIIDALLRGDAPYEPDWVIGANILLILIIGFLFCLLMPACGPLTMTIMGLGSAIAFATINCWLWQNNHLDLPASGPLVTIALVYGLNLSYGFFSTSHQKTQIKSMFGQYVAPAHIERLLNDTSALSFEGESKEMTVLFADVRSFTSISEKLTAQELKDLLNRYFTPMTEIIFDQQGTIDKYVGDMIMAFWGAPLPDDNQKEHAVNAALMMLEKLDALHHEFQSLNYPDLRIGIGINTGMMNVGDMGSVYRRAYTVLGDSVNFGSRLESITKFYGVSCLVSESTKIGLESKFIFREVDYVQVKGKKEPIRIYQPLARIKNLTSQLSSHVEQYEKARHLYLNKKWSESALLFTELTKEDSTSEKLYQVYLERISLYQKESVPSDWCGIWRHDEK